MMTKEILFQPDALRTERMKDAEDEYETNVRHASEATQRMPIPTTVHPAAVLPYHLHGILVYWYIGVVVSSCNSDIGWYCGCTNSMLELNPKQKVWDG